MINVIVELSKYVILTLMVVYTFHCFYMVRRQDEDEKNEALRQQLVLIFFMDFTAFLVIYLKTDNFQVITFYLEMMAYFAVIQILYRVFYKKASLLLLNNMCMLLSVGFIMLCRLDIGNSYKAACDCSSSECGCACDSGYDTENEISQKSYLGICWNRHCSSGGSFCAGADQLRSETFSYGIPALRGN